MDDPDARPFEFLPDEETPVAEPAIPPSPVTEDVEHDHDEVLPWWRNPINVVAIAVSIALLSGTLGFVVGNNQALPSPNATDVGFLQDMRAHHEQAVQLSFIYLDDADTRGDLEVIAREILVGQDMEIGRMIQLLRDYGEFEANDSADGTAMAWMGERVPLDRMPGLATQDDLRSLADATGAEADSLFVRLMTAHHEGGIHMAEYATEHAAESEVRTMAEAMASSQREEIVEMAALLARPTGG